MKELTGAIGNMQYAMGNGQYAMGNEQFAIGYANDCGHKKGAPLPELL